MHKEKHIIESTLDGNPAVSYSIGGGFAYEFRKRRLARFIVDFGRRRNAIHLSSDQHGLVLFYQSDILTSSLRSLWDELCLGVCAIGVFRILRVLKRSRLIHREQRQWGRFVHCWYIGVDPQSRSLSAARELRDLLFNEADRLCLPVLAETTIVKNKKVYERIGFEVYSELNMGGMLTYLLIRKPKKS